MVSLSFPVNLIDQKVVFQEDNLSMIFCQSHKLLLRGDIKFLLTQISILYRNTIFSNLQRQKSQTFFRQKVDEIVHLI